MANKDLFLLETLLTHMPNAYLMVQTSDPEYIESMLGQLGEELRSKLSKRVFVVTKMADKRKSLKCKKSMRNLFQNFDDATQFKTLGESTSGASYDEACRDIFSQLTQMVTKEAESVSEDFT